MPLVVTDKGKADRIDVRAEGKWWTRLAGTGTIYPTAGLSYRDVCQGQMGNCWFLCAPLAIALKQQGADFLRNRLLDNGDEWVFCELWDGGQRPHLMKAKKQFAKQKASTDGTPAITTESSALWVSMFQVFGAAFVSNNENVAKVTYEPKNPNLNRLNDGFAHVPLAMLTGKNAGYGNIADGGAYTTVQARHAAGYPVTLDSKGVAALLAAHPAAGVGILNHVVVQGIVGSHTYAVWDIGNHQFGPVGVGNPPVPAIRLCNPWGRCTRAYSTKDNYTVIDVQGQGDFWIPWDAVQASFLYYNWAEQQLGNAIAG
jgi:hypothetical protein